MNRKGGRWSKNPDTSGLKKSVANFVAAAGRGASLLFIIYFGAKFTSLRLSTEPIYFMTAAPCHAPA